MQGRLAIVVGSLLKQRLLAGALRLQPEEIRREGAGQLLGRVIESEAVGSLAIGGGFVALLAVLELALAAGVLAIATAAPRPSTRHLGRVHRSARGRLSAAPLRWVGRRVGLTHDLIERMVGHRTRIAQQPREQWHDGEDETLERYVHASRGWTGCGLAARNHSTRLDGGRCRGADRPLRRGRIRRRRWPSVSAGFSWRAGVRPVDGRPVSLAGALIAWRQTATVFQQLRADGWSPVGHARAASRVVHTCRARSH
jgi:ATP-binding cassette subfamily B protein